MEIQKFNPTKAEIQKAISEVEGLTIKDVADIEGYNAVKAARKRLGDYRIKITKFGKEQREEAIKWQKEVLRQEKELVGMIEPTESKLKGMVEGIDAQKKREERRILLPTRKKMLEDIGTVVSDEELLDLDEKEFSAYYGELRIAYDVKQAEEKRKKEEEEKRKEELEKAKKEAAEKAKKDAEEKAEREKAEAEKKRKEELEAKEREKKEALEKAEKEKQEAIDKIKREQEEKERKEREEKERLEREAKEKERKEKEEREAMEKDQKYKNWLKKHGVDEKTMDGIHFIEREGNKLVLYKKIDEITL